MFWPLWTALAVAAAPDPTVKTQVDALIEAALAQDEAWQELAWICDRIGARISGSPQLEEAVRYTATRMKEDGLSVLLEPVDVPHWIRGPATLTELAPTADTRSLLALGGSVSTPDGGIEADVLVVSSFEELKARSAEADGRIVVYDVPFTDYGATVRYRWAGADQAAAHGAVAALVRSVTPESLDTPHTGSMGYTGDVPKIPTAAITVEDAARYHRLQDAGVTPRLKLELEARFAEDKPSHNVVGELKGREKPEEIVVLGCHLDSWDVGQGAHDDAAGCVAVMEALALIRASGTVPRRTVRAVLFTNEENGLRGGRAYAEAHADETIIAALESDTGGGAPLGFGIDVRDDAGERSEATAKTVRAHLDPWLPLLAPLGATDFSPGYGGADISPTVKQGAVGFGLRNDMEPYWRIHHTEADTLDKVDPAAVQKNVAAVAALAWLLAELPEPLPPEVHRK